MLWVFCGKKHRQDIIVFMSDDLAIERWLATLEETPLGPISCVVSENGLTQVLFSGLEEARYQLDTAGLETRHPLPARPNSILQEALAQVQLYFQRELQSFQLPLDLRGCTPFQRHVLDEVMRIPYGQVVTYGAIAEKVGGMKKVRAVGGAVGSNPMPVVIPCHRVLARNGHLVGYSGRGGIKTKAWLLSLEGYFLVSEELD
jgi:methylated-DNA-[protein]-cysteine S-methyltransferase